MTEQEYICEFCGKEFENSKKLNIHKSSNAECLKKRGIYKQIYNCEFCNKEYTSKNALATHVKTKKCLEIKIPLKKQIIELENIIESKDEEIKKLKIKIDVLTEIQTNLLNINSNKFVQ